MKPIEYRLLYDFVDAKIDEFYTYKTAVLDQTRLADILKKNPYLFRAKNPLTPEELIASMLDARLSSSEEKKFGDLLEDIAIFVSQMTCEGRKSSAKGIDLEFDDADTRYLVAIKSGTNWGNSSQYQALERNFRVALQVQNQARPKFRVQPVLGMCYGKMRDADTGLYLKKCGQSFWHFVSGERELYFQIFIRVGQRADDHKLTFLTERAALQAKLVETFRADFCLPDGGIDWPRLLTYNSGNLKSSL